MKYLRRGSGYYIDVGASELVADGKVKVKTRRHREDHPHRRDDGPTALSCPPTSSSGATGYGSMKRLDRAPDRPGHRRQGGQVLGLGSGTRKDPGPWEGELRNMWKPTQQPNLWMQGGNLHQNRHYSLCVALQLKARMGRRPTTRSTGWRRCIT